MNPYRGSPTSDIKLPPILARDNLYRELEIAGLTDIKRNVELISIIDEQQNSQHLTIEYISRASSNTEVIRYDLICISLITARIYSNPNLY